MITYAGSCTDVYIVGKWAILTLYDPSRFQEFKIKQQVMTYFGYYVNKTHKNRFITRSLTPYQRCSPEVQQRMTDLIDHISLIEDILNAGVKLEKEELYFHVLKVLTVSSYLPDYLRDFFKWCLEQPAICLDLDEDNLLWDKATDRIIPNDLIYYTWG
jgi:hypothetical protein